MITKEKLKQIVDKYSHTPDGSVDIMFELANLIKEDINNNDNKKYKVVMLYTIDIIGGQQICGAVPVHHCENSKLANDICDSFNSYYNKSSTKITFIVEEDEE